MWPVPAYKEASVGAFVYARHRPELTLLYQLVDVYYAGFQAHPSAQGKALPAHVEREFEAYLESGRLEHGVLRVRCDSRHAEHLGVFSCKRRGFCPSCGARRMVESAALLVDEVFPEQLVRQEWCYPAAGLAQSINRTGGSGAAHDLVGDGGRVRQLAHQDGQEEWCRDAPFTDLRMESSPLPWGVRCER